MFLKRIMNRIAPPLVVAAAAAWFEIRNLAEAGTAEIKLFGLIGESKMKRDWNTGEMVPDDSAAGTLREFEVALLALGDVKNLQVSIFSQGGDWSTGVAIHNLLVRHPAKKVCIIDGLCASAATYAAMGCDEIRIPSNASMLIHEASAYASGTASDLRASADSLDSITNNIAELYAARTGAPVEDMRALMAAARYLSGAECVQLKLADTLIEPLTNLAARAGSLQPTNSISLDSAPVDVLALFDMRGMSRLAPFQNMKPVQNSDVPPVADAPPVVVPPVVADAPPVVVADAPPVVVPPVVVPPVAEAPPLTIEAVQNLIAPVVAENTRLAGELLRIQNLSAAGVLGAAAAGAAPVPGAAPVLSALDQIKNLTGTDRTRAALEYKQTGKLPLWVK